MTIIINDLEVVVESLEDAAALGSTESEGEGAQTPMQPALAPQDLERVLLRQFERLERIRAH